MARKSELNAVQQRRRMKKLFMVLLYGSTRCSSSRAHRAAALFSWLFIGAGAGDRRSSRAERGGVALFWGGDPGRRGAREKVVIGCRECGTRDVSGLDRRDGSEAIQAGMELPGVEEERSEFSRPKLTPEVHSSSKDQSTKPSVPVDDRPSNNCLPTPASSKQLPSLMEGDIVIRQRRNMAWTRVCGEARLHLPGTP